MGRADGGRRRLGCAASRPRRPRAAPAGEGARVPRPGHHARRHAREARHGVGRRDGQGVVHRQASARAVGRAPHGPEARRIRVRRGTDRRGGAPRGAAPGGRRDGRPGDVGGTLDRARPRDRARLVARSETVSSRRSSTSRGTAEHERVSCPRRSTIPPERVSVAELRRGLTHGRRGARIRGGL